MAFLETDVFGTLIAISGVVGAIGGVAVAYFAVTAKHRRLDAERNLRPLREEFFRGVIDEVPVIGRQIRVSVYDPFVVVRAPGVAALVRYEQIAEINVSRVADRDVVIFRIHGVGLPNTVRITGESARGVAALVQRKRDKEGVM